MARVPVLRLLGVAVAVMVLYSLLLLMRPDISASDIAAATVPAEQPPPPPVKLPPLPPIRDQDKELQQGNAQIESQELLPIASPGSERVKATFVTLARNKELYALIESMRSVEDRFNHKYNYDWVFLNDEPFTQEFKDLTSAIVSGKTKYGLIPKEHWSYPEWIDQDKAAETRKKMKADGIIYGDLESYRHMCRFESGFFWRNPLLDEYDWYWRVEPETKVHCDLDYDVFKWMKDNNKVYGFTISIHEFDKTIPTLWKHTKDFIRAHPEHLAHNNLMDFISNDGGDTYNLCHFWSNFEVANLNFWRSQAYREYFEYLDRAGGFFYERWGDAPVHSIAAALFLPRDKIHYFEDVGYNHGVYTQCPLNNEFRYKHKCHCNPEKDFTFDGYSCTGRYYDVMKMPKPKEAKE
ncbi:glycosyltransferase family 15 protein [Suhomyces tanzawaensis NRRL Y-17324]|uniref:Glycosyltransferase family 15 protein n=1 Tax=Suhomyces tanzawaensis NRRL Y-17324 TaxID=984487 RepID=A0A1E4SQ30_9ASCO|nr:glycosyltransferase family 15 protein [Suhomyces tanzawaensis NRRL Y-17324]ODV81522.1 glycosyltransferase family 15 protein [Suhomyces tanzawaensis NRRL Y-17324]